MLNSDGKIEEETEEDSYRTLGMTGFCFASRGRRSAVSYGRN